MLAVRCIAQSGDKPMDGLSVAECDGPAVPDGWIRVWVRTAALNHHDLWSLRGVGLDPSYLPMTLGSDAAGVLDDGTDVIVHSVIGDPAAGDGDETLDPKRSVLSEHYHGTLAEQVVVPARNAVPKPASLSWEEAACLPTAWLTAYRMLTTRSGLTAPGNVLVQGAGGGVATAAIVLAKALGHKVFCTSRDPARAARAHELGADVVAAMGARLSEKMDVVVETVGQTSWSHSLRALRPGGRVVVCGSTSGPNPPADLARVFFLQLSIVGSTMGTRDELVGLIRLLVETGVRPAIADVRPLADARRSFEQLTAGTAFGKLVLTVG